MWLLENRRMASRAALVLVTARRMGRRGREASLKADQLAPHQRA